MSGVEITQADRDAAAALTYETMRGGLNWSSAKRIRDTIANGKWDAHYAVQAFARHRQSATAPLIAALEEARDALEGLANREQEYRRIHDIKGDGHIDTGRAWDTMRRSGDNARAALTRITAELAKHKGNSDEQG